MKVVFVKKIAIVEFDECSNHFFTNSESLFYILRNGRAGKVHGSDQKNKSCH